LETARVREIAERQVQSARVKNLVDKAREPRYHVFETAIVVDIDFLTFEGFHIADAGAAVTQWSDV
jgi:hypothetical protein